MLDLLRRALSGKIEIIGSGSSRLILRRELSAKVCRSDVELFSVDASFFAAAGFPVEKLSVSIQKRQKGEVPGSEQLPTDGTALIADPAIILSDGKSCLLCGFLDLDIHLGRFEWSLSGLRAIADYHPAYRPATENIFSQRIICLAGNDPVALLNCYAEAIADHYHLDRAKRFPRYTVGANWHYYGPTMTEAQLDEELTAIRQRNIPLDVYQLDDGWQKDYGNWEANSKWPSGMEAAANKIRTAGMIPGIWITPFLCGENSAPAFPDEWLLRDSDGNNLTMQIGKIPFLIFDPSRPEVQEYIRGFLLKIKSWGFRYYKIDFTRCLFLDPAACPFDRTITLLQLYRMGIQLIRDTLGDDCCLNLCGGHEGATVGLADITRTGRDTYGKWHKPNDEPWIRIRECVMRSWMDRFRMGDPDASIMRINSEPLPATGDYTPHRYTENYASLSQGFLSDVEAETFVLNQFLCGGIAEIGERLPDLSDHRLALLRKVVPLTGTPAQPLDFFTSPMPQFYRTEITPACPQLASWEIISALNIADETADLVFPEKFPVPTMVFDLSEMKLAGIYHPGDQLVITGVPAHGSKVLKFIRLPEKRHAFFVADDLHYSGGGVEISAIKINDSTITGQMSSPWCCQVKIAGAFPLTDGKSWQVVTAECSSNGTFALTLE